MYIGSAPPHDHSTSNHRGILSWIPVLFYTTNVSTLHLYSTCISILIRVYLVTKDGYSILNTRSKIRIILMKVSCIEGHKHAVFIQYVFVCLGCIWNTISVLYCKHLWLNINHIWISCSGYRRCMLYKTNRSAACFSMYPWVHMN